MSIPVILALVALVPFACLLTFLGASRRGRRYLASTGSQAATTGQPAGPGYGAIGAFAVTFSYCMVLGHAGILAVSHRTA